MTAKAAWTAAESIREAWDLPVPVSSAVTFPSPGVVQAVRRANIYVRADYLDQAARKTRDYTIHAYAIDPTSPPVPLAYISGSTYAAGTPPAPLGGVTVEIIDGDRMGTRAVTLDNGAFLLEFMRLGTPFTMRASRAGYRTAELTHPGVVDNALGYPANAFLRFDLVPIQ